MIDKKELEKVFEKFLLNSVGKKISEDSNEVVDMEKQFNIKIPLSLKKLLNIIAKGADINFGQWSLKDPSEIFLSRKLNLGKNLFEQLIVKDQENSSSSSIIEILTNSIFLGYMENKDRYYANINISRNDKVEVVYLNNKSNNYEFLFSDSIESFIFSNFILDKIKYISDDEAIPLDYFKSQMKLIEKRVNFPEQFNSVVEHTGIEPSYRSYFPEAVYLYWRALWIVNLLKANSIKDVHKIRDIFNVIDRKSINKSEDQIKSVNSKTPAFKAIYWIWYFFFFNKIDVLNEYLESIKIIPSPLVRDTIILIKELLDGRKSLGRINDIYLVKTEFLKLNLDPDNKGKRVYRDVKNDMSMPNKELSIKTIKTKEDQDKTKEDQDKTKEDQDKTKEDQDKIKEGKDKTKEGQDKTKEGQDKTKEGQDKIKEDKNKIKEQDKNLIEKVNENNELKKNIVKNNNDIKANEIIDSKDILNEEKQENSIEINKDKENKENKKNENIKNSINNNNSENKVKHKKITENNKIIPRNTNGNDNFSYDYKVNLILENIDRKNLDNVIWEYIDDKKIIEKLFEYYRNLQKDCEEDFLRYDYIKKEMLNTNREKNEVYEVLLNRNTKLAPLFYTQKIYEFGLDYIKRKVIWFIVNDKIDDLERFVLNIGLEYYPQIYNESFEERLINMLPDCKKEETFIDEKANAKFIKVLNLLSKVKSKKATEIVIKYFDYYNKIINDSSDGSKKEREIFYKNIGTYLFDYIVKTSDEKLIPIIKPWINTPIGNKALLALIDLRDKEVIKYLEKINKRQFGNYTKRIFNWFILEYAKYINGNDSDLEIVKKSLSILLDNKDNVIKVFNNSMEILAFNMGKESIKYIKVFLDFEYMEVRKKAKELLEELGEDIKIIYLDVPFVNEFYKKEGKEKLITILKNENAVFKHNILKKISDENENIEGFEMDVINYLKTITRFKYSFSDSLNLGDLNEIFTYAASYNNKIIDDFICEFVNHSNDIYRQLPANVAKSEKSSIYLIKKVKELLNKEKIEKDEGIKLNRHEYGNKLWSSGIHINKISVSKTGKYCAVAGDSRIIIFSSDGEIKKEIQLPANIIDINFSESNEKLIAALDNNALYICYVKKSENLKLISGSKGLMENIIGISYSKDGNKFIVFDMKGKMCIYRSEDLNFIKVIDTKKAINSFDWINENEGIISTMDGLNAINLDTEVISFKKRLISKHIKIYAKGDGNTLIVVVNDYLTILDSKLNEIKKINYTNISNITFSPDGKSLYMIAENNKIKNIFNINLKTFDVTKLNDPSNLLATSLDIHPRMGIIYVGTSKGNVFSWSNDNQPIMHVNIGHVDKITDMSYSKKYDCVVSSSSDGMAIMWFANKSGLVLYNNDKTKKIETISISKDERYIVYGMKDLIVKNDTLTGKNIEISTKGHCNKMVPYKNNQVLSAVEDTLYFIGNDNTIKMDNKISNLIILNEKEKLVLTIKNERRIFIYDLNNLKIEKEFDLLYDNYEIISFDVTSEEELLFILCSDSTIRAYSTDSWEIEKEIFLDETSDKICIFDSDEKIVLTNKNKLSIIDTNEFKIISKTNFDAEITKIMKFDEDSFVVGFDNGTLVKIMIDDN
ncbi:MAG: hypothetical protein ABF289_00985 [Clostridiales bacterium]